MKELKVEQNIGFVEAQTTELGCRGVHIFLRWIRLQEARRLCSHLEAYAGLRESGSEPACVQEWRQFAERGETWERAQPPRGSPALPAPHVRPPRPYPRSAPPRPGSLAAVRRGGDEAAAEVSLAMRTRFSAG